MEKNPITFVNFLGDKVSTRAIAPQRRIAKPKESFHRGWRVQGVPPGAMELARKTHIAKEIFRARKEREPKLFSESDWLRSAPLKPIHSRPYSMPEAAKVCAEIASKSGCLRVEVTELSKQVHKAP